MKYAPGCLCPVHKALDYLNTALKGCLSPWTVMHTCNMNAQKAQLDSAVFLSTPKAHDHLASEKKQRLSVGRNRKGYCIFVSYSLASLTICVLSSEILRCCDWGLLEKKLTSLCCSQFRDYSEEASTDTLSFSVITSNCPVSNQASLMCGKCVQTT